MEYDAVIRNEGAIYTLIWKYLQNGNLKSKMLNI